MLLMDFTINHIDLKFSDLRLIAFEIFIQKNIFNKHQINKKKNQIILN